MKNWTLDEWLNDLDDCAKQGLYFKISDHNAGLLRDQIKKAVGDTERLREALKELLNVIPNFPPDGNFLVGMKERYNQALIEARAGLKESE